MNRYIESESLELKLKYTDTICNVGLNVGLNKTEKKILDFLIENPNFTSNNLAEKIGVTTRTIERSLKKLQEKKPISRIGSKRTGSWLVLNNTKF